MKKFLLMDNIMDVIFFVPSTKSPVLKNNEAPCPSLAILADDSAESFVIGFSCKAFMLQKVDLEKDLRDINM